MELNYLSVEEQIKAAYRQVTAQYRRDDEIEVTTPNHRRLRQLLGQICRSFGKDIRVLDVGCGTGRYFHCLQNVACLVGIDVSEEMLKAAGRPVLHQAISATKIELIQANAYLASFPLHSFDFIYSLGMFGHGCPVTARICNSFFRWLAPGGRLLFNTVDFAGLPICYQVRRRVRSVVYPLLTRNLRDKLDAREQRSPFFGMARRELVRVIANSHFHDFEVTSHPCQSPLWNGRHLQCLARKDITPSKLQ